jgi:CubicO group peptidase (beta-lactamase class C family)
VTPALEDALAGIDGWDVPAAAVAVVTADGAVVRRGGTAEPGRIASVSKLLTGYAIQLAVAEGAIGLDDAAGPRGATLRHLLAHCAGYGFESDAAVIARPGTRRIYSNRGIEEAAAHVTAATGIAFADYVRESVTEPLRLAATEVSGSPAFGYRSTVDDLVAFAAELLAPRLLDGAALAAAVEVAFPGLTGVVPGVGRFDPCDWGLGFERNFGRARHWAGTSLAAATFGHFGGSGSFLWVDPTRGLAAACLTGREFGPWALELWPALCTAIVAAHDNGPTPG